MTVVGASIYKNQQFTKENMYLIVQTSNISNKNNKKKAKFFRKDSIRTI